MAEMTERIDQYLDGRLDPANLTPDERLAAEAAERAIEQTRAYMGATSSPDLTARVMREIEALPVRHNKALESAFARLVNTWWTPRRVEFVLRPAYVVSAAMAVVLVVFLSYGWGTRTVPAVASVSAEPRLFVQFRLEAPDASNVQLAGSFTNWQPRYELHQAAPGVWTITVPLSLGVHDYAFVVDGQRWVADPYAQHVDDGFGGLNSRIALLPPDTSRS
jgi:hypothetical protein